MHNDYIIWIGNIFEDDEFIDNPSISPAGNQWQTNAITSIRNLGIKVVLMSYQQECAWPRGKLIAIRKQQTSNEDQTWIAYLNIPYLRDWFIYKRLRKKTLSYIDIYGRPACVITYNPYKHNGMLGQAICKKGVKWINIWADSCGLGDRCEKAPKEISKANSHIFLSYYAYLSL